MADKIADYKFHPDCESFTLYMHSITGDGRLIEALEKYFTPADLKALKAKGKKLSDAKKAHDPINAYFAFLIDAAIRQSTQPYQMWKMFNR
jgi:hypothetical protein